MRLNRRVVRGLRGVERTQQTKSSAVHDVEEDDAVAARGVLGFENEEVCGKFDFPLAVSRSEVDIRNDLIAWICRVDGEVGLPVKLLIGADRAERLAVQDVDPPCDLHADELGMAESRREDQEDS